MRVRIGTRGSQLALAQTQEFIDSIQQANPHCEFEMKVIQTLGDRKQGTQFASMGDKQDWIQGIDTALLDNEIDLAIHSGKDIPVDYNPETKCVPVGKRQPANDVFIPQKGTNFTYETLPPDVLIGTASLRRKAQILNFNPNAKVVAHRGNINNRLVKLYSSEDLGGIVLAYAGLRRINLINDTMQVLPLDLSVPAVNQGMLVAHYHKDRDEMKKLVSASIDKETFACFTAERQTVILLEADCHSAIGTYAFVKDNQIKLHTRVLSYDGSEMIESIMVDDLANAEALGRKVAEDLLVKGASRLLAESTAIQASWTNGSI